MADFPQIFTFYSYKGGVGRSMACLNLAYALAGKGRHVLLVDMDLEAPGLSIFIERKGELKSRSEFDSLDLVQWAQGIALTSPKEGIDEDYVRTQGPPLVAYAVPLKRDDEFKYLVPSLGKAGRLDFTGVHQDTDYFKRLQKLRLHEMSQDQLLNTSRVLKIYFKSRSFDQEFPSYYGTPFRQVPYDYVLVDSRTGITEIGGLCIGPLAEYLVVVTSLNEQNVFGTRDFLKHVGIEVKGRRKSSKEDQAAQEGAPTPEHLGPKPTILVASPVPAGEIKFKQDRFAALEKEFGIRPAKLSYHPQVSLIESIFVRDYPEEYLAVEYQELTNRIMALANDHELQLARRYAKEWENSEWAAAVQDVVRLAPQNPELGESLLRQVAGRFEPKKEDEFIAVDQMFAILGQLAQPVCAMARVDRALNLVKWADWTYDPGLREKRFSNAIPLLTEVIEMPEAPVKQKARAYVNRGVACDKKGEPDKAIADYTTVIEKIPEAPVEQKAGAYVNRGVACDKKGEPDKAIADYTTVIEMPEAPVEQKARAYVNRGVAFGKKGEPEKEIANYTAVIEMPEAPVEQKARAYVNRGVAFREKGELEKAIADCTAVIEMPEAAVEHKVDAYLTRCLVFKEKKDLEKAIADCTAVIEIPESKGEAKENAYGNLGFWLYLQGKYRESIEASSKALDINPNSTLVRANLGLALLHVGYTKRALEEYTEVIAKIQDPEQLDREVITDISEALNTGRKVPGASEALDLAEQRRKELQQKTTD